MRTCINNQFGPQISGSPWPVPPGQSEYPFVHGDRILGDHLSMGTNQLGINCGGPNVRGTYAFGTKCVTASNPLNPLDPVDPRDLKAPIVFGVHMPNKIVKLSCYKQYFFFKVTNDFMDEFAEDEKLGPEELQKKIDKTNRKLIKKRDELAFISNRVRVHDLGQDRYRRRYHHFAYAGGVFVEAVESCEPWKLETQGIKPFHVVMYVIFGPYFGTKICYDKR